MREGTSAGSSTTASSLLLAVTEEKSPRNVASFFIELLTLSSKAWGARAERRRCSRATAGSPDRVRGQVGKRCLPFW